MNKTFAGFFDSSRQATGAVDDLLLHGYTREFITVLASSTANRTAASVDVVEQVEAAPERAEKGAMMGGFAGLLVGLAAVLIPGVGPLLILGPAATALVSAGLGATAGGLLGGLTDLGITQERAQLYVEGMRRGGTLLLVKADEKQEPEVMAIMARHGAGELGERTEHDERPATHDTSPPSSPPTERVVVRVDDQASGERATVPEGNTRARCPADGAPLWPDAPAPGDVRR